MRDVIEHIHDQDLFMDYVKRFLKPGAVFFLAFPPWYNPFGGHQQICANKYLSKLPYFHLLPNIIYRSVLKLGGEPPERIESLLEIKETGISIERFEKILKKYNYSILSKQLFLVNPNYEIKFGLRPRRQNKLIANIPFISDIFTTSAYYLISIE
jgi:hypothetical protein